MTIEERNQLIRDLEQAIKLTQLTFDNCNTPSLKDMYLESIKGYEKRLEEVRNGAED